MLRATCEGFSKWGSHLGQPFSAIPHPIVPRFSPLEPQFIPTIQFFLRFWKFVAVGIWERKVCDDVTNFSQILAYFWGSCPQGCDNPKIWAALETRDHPLAFYQKSLWSVQRLGRLPIWRNNNIIKDKKSIEQRMPGCTSHRHSKSKVREFIVRHMYSLEDVIVGAGHFTAAIWLLPICPTAESCWRPAGWADVPGSGLNLCRTLTLSIERRWI